jgi:hypothetical protein
MKTKAKVKTNARAVKAKAKTVAPKKQKSKLKAKIVKPKSLPKEPVPNPEDFALSTVACNECNDLIPKARLRLVKTNVCVGCMEKKEHEGTGTVRHRIAFEVVGSEEVEAVNLHLVRAKD